MRVLQVVHQFLPRYVGGTELYVADLCRRLRECGHEMSIFAGADEARLSTWEGFQLTTVTGGVRGPRGAAKTFLTTFGNREAEESFLEVLERFRPDLVHFHHLLGLSGKLPFLAKERGVPTCYTLHDYWFLCPKTQLIDHAGEVCRGPVAGLNCGVCAAERLGSLAFAVGAPLVAPLFLRRQHLVRQSIGATDAILAPSRFIADLAAANGLERDKITLVDFGLPSQEAEQARWEPRGPGAPLRVTYLGAIAWHKGVHVLVEACRSLSPGTIEVIEVKVYGDLSMYPDYSRRVQQQAQGLPIYFGGLASRESVPEVLATSDLLVVPSLWYENAPLVIGEAFAAGVPVIASRLGALAEKVRDGVDGLLFARGDAQDLAQVLERVAREPLLLEGLRKQVGGTATRTQHIYHMESIYAALVARQPLLEQVR